MTITAHPLTWPTGWKRTAPNQQREAKFARYDKRLTLTQGLDRVLLELQRMGIDLTDRETGKRTELGQVIDRIKARPVTSIKLLCTASGTALTRPMLRTRFEAARAAAAAKATTDGDAELATRILRMWFTDNRPKAASDIDDIKDASKLLGHSEEDITRKVYRRVGERAKPTR